MISSFPLIFFLSIAIFNRGIIAIILQSIKQIRDSTHPQFENLLISFINFPNIILKENGQHASCFVVNHKIFLVLAYVNW